MNALVEFVRLPGPWVVVTTAVGCGACVGSAVVGLELLGATYMTPDGSLGGFLSNALDGQALFGVIVTLLVAVYAPIAAGGLIVRAGLSQNSAGRGAAALAVAIVLATSLASAVASTVVLVVPDQTFNAGTAQPDTLRQFLGGLLLAVSLAVALAAAGALGTILRHDIKRKVPQPGDFQPSTLLANWQRLALLAVTAAAVLASTAVFTAIWNFSSTSYFRFQSPYSILDPTLAWVLGPVPNATLPSGAPNTWVQPVIYFKLYADVVVYFSALAGVVAVGLVATYWLPARRALHRRIGGACIFPKALAWADPFAGEGGGVSLGELMLASAIASLYAFWVWYWGFQYTRIPQEIASLNDEHPRLHTTARLVGHLTTLTMSFLALPVTRNSVWESVFGVPFDRAIKFHRLLGALCWALVTYHMALWMAKWAVEGTLARNFLALGVEITPCELSGGACFTNGSDSRQFTWASYAGPADGFMNVTCGCVFWDATAGVANYSGAWHGDNWTVAVATGAWALLTAALVIAVAARRASYELFLVTHTAALVFFAAGLVHAWSHWYYTALPLLLWVFDKAARVAASARAVHVLSLNVAAPGVTRLVVDARFLRGKSTHAGQYAWICVPDVSPVEWHPFTLSSPPAAARDSSVPGGVAASAVLGSLNSGGESTGSGDGAAAGGSDGGNIDDASGVVVFHIKDMGPSTWTARLAALARTRAGTLAPQPALTMAIDGPYGRADALGDADTLVLVAGGIGITPALALATEALARARAPAVHGTPPPRLRRVVFVFVARGRALLEVFARPLAAIASDASGTFELHLHCTSPSVTTSRRTLSSPRSAFSLRTLTASSQDAPAVVGEGAAAALLAPGADGCGDDDVDDDATEWESTAASAGDRRAVEAGWSSPAEAAAVRKLVRRGRPDLTKLLRRAADDARSKLGDASYAAHADIVVMACGPHALVDSASAAAHAVGAGFHAEVFHF